MSPCPRDYYRACNTAELYQLCAHVGLVVSPATARDVMVSYLLGEEEPPPMVHPVHIWRNGLIGLIQDYWTGIEAQLQCPAKELGPPAREGDPPKPSPEENKLACFRCVDTRVIACLVDNAAHEHLIQLRRELPEKRMPMTTTIGMLTLDNAPRTMAGMEEGDGVGRGALQRLFNALVAEGFADGSEQSVVAFVDGNTAVRRQLVVNGLQARDRARGTSTAPPTPQVQQTVPLTPTPVTTAPIAEEPAKRTPVNRGKPTNGNGEDSGNVGKGIIDALVGVKAGLEGLAAQLEVLRLQQAETQAQILALQAQQQAAALAMGEMQRLSSAIVLWQIEQGGDTSPSEVLAQAAPYKTIFERALGKGD